ncbi:MAG: M24 family metallopeptidase [Thermoleophilaceae bacterium]
MSAADRLADRLAERELDALLVTYLPNVRYLTGYTGSNGVCIVGAEQRDFITDFRYVEQVKREVQGFDRIEGKQDLMGDVAERLRGRVGFEDQHMTVRAHKRLRDLVGEGTELVAAGGMVEDLRAVKTPDEIARIREAAKLADGILEYVRERGLVGRTERDVAVDLEHEMRERGAEEPSFPSIVAAGPNGALPHAVPGTDEITAGQLVVVDLGCRVDGWCSDCTRTFATGELDDGAREVYDLVLRAQLEALGAIHAGAGNREVDGVARSIIDSAGYGERFGHGLGHGVGLEVHEGPRLSRLAPEDARLEAGNVVTVEPGVYLPGELGVRIEDLVVVTDDGSEILSGFPKELVTVEG